ncbi:hypothetical protein KGD83_16115 [Nocardiopsis akebiae]|uniref:Uncharacterized protein n=1 Tax=Nocardiopsis akebiae TaxID=2831968 RepID=A0ABX8C1B8_9ACTN|nr:hypothetical protein [Nocardiopsis akebiae]QUX26893.1 hypothetical protein KGD83_16115 [Nocardiopsis akebiae]
MSMIFALLSVPVPVLAEQGTESESPGLGDHAEEFFAENPPSPDAVTPDFGDADKVVPAWKNGDISVDELVRYGYLTVFDPDELPPEYAPEEDGELDVGSYVPFVLSHVDEASEETRAWLHTELDPAVSDDA